MPPATFLPWLGMTNGSPAALVSQTKMLGDAGLDLFSWQFVDYYGMNKDQLVLWNTFLDGKSSVADLTKGLQSITDDVANDSSVKKIEIK